MDLIKNIRYKNSNKCPKEGSPIICLKHITGLILLCVCFVIPKAITAQAVHTNCAFDKGSWSPKTSSNKRLMDDEEVLYIPVVLHVVYNGDNQNLSDEQINSQLQVINEDFNLANENRSETEEAFKSLAANIAIKFYLAEDNGVIGITRTSTTHGAFFNNDLHLSSTGGQDAWDTEKYLNVWIADLASGVFGYGTAPSTPAFRDGVAIHYEYFGKNGSAVAPYDLGRTLTHEIGHWMGLLHPWGDGGCDSDDGLTDTPSQETSTIGCNLSQISCGSQDMVQNFMNTSEDACMNLFTKQQQEVMRNTVIEHRPEVYNLEGLVTAVSPSVQRTALSVYPNPVTEEPLAYASMPADSGNQLQINLFDALGRKVREYKEEKTNNSVAIRLEGLNNGVYVAEMSNRRTSYSSKVYLNIE